MNKIRVRFAPSPTGYMHIANFRTAIYNWLFAKQNNGEFLIRIEDTDFERSKDHYEKAIFDTFDKFQLDIANRNNYMRQSERIELYKTIGKQLYKQGDAFYCKCQQTANECTCRDSGHTNGVLRFKVPKDIDLTFNDMIGGECTRNTNDIEAFSLIRSDGIATYNFAVVIDDNEMDITHVIRGEDHRTNTFKQILVYKAMKWNIPEFGHLPLILGEDGGKLSKRKSDTSIDNLINQGYPKEAIFNMIIRIGWGYKDEEIINKERALEIFDVHNVSRNAAAFDSKKLDALSAHYLRTGDYTKEIASVFTNDTYDTIKEIYDDLTSRCVTINECQEMCKFIFEDTLYTPGDTTCMQEISELDNTLSFEDWFQSIKKYPNDKLIRKTIREIITNSTTGLPLSIIYKYRIQNKKIV
jgi:glutamyl-tRNA synthetase